MILKTLLFILLLTVTFVGFSQKKTIENLSTAPNPFANFTKINFKSNVNSSVLLTVRNILGKIVFKKTYAMKMGKNSIPFYKDDLVSGIYIYSIQNHDILISKRFVIQ